MTKSMRFLSIVILLSLPAILTIAQDRVDESAVQLEQRFIEANLEKILGNYDKAIAIYEEIQKKDRKNAAAAYEIARIYDILAENDKAVRSIKTAIELDPENLWYKKLLADLYQKTGNNADAAQLYESMIKIDPGNEQLYYRWAYFLVKANDLGKALKVYDDLEKQTGLNEEVIRHKHSLYLGMGNYKKAGQELERLIKAFPHEIEYRHLLAEFYLQTGDQGAARKVYQDILSIDPEDSKAKLALSGGARDTAVSGKGIADQMRAIFEDPKVDIDLKIGRIMPFIQEVANTGNKQMAQELLQLTAILEQVHPNEAKAFSASGDLLYYSGQPAEALKKYQRTLELDDTVYLVWEQIMYIHYAARDYEKLRRIAEEAIDLFPNKGRAHYFAGLAYCELGNAEEAAAVLEQALLMAGRDGQLVVDVQTQLGLCYAQLNKPGNAQQAFEAALELNAKDPTALNNYSYFLAQRGEQLERAAEMARTANQLTPNQPLCQDTYGWIFYKMQDYRKAREWVGKALENGGDEYPNILEHYGDILFQLNEKEAAVEYWQKALDQGSSSKILQKKITDRQLYE